MCDKYNDHAKKYFSTEEEFLLDRVRNYFSPISNYFSIKKMIEDPKTSEDKKDGLKKLLEKIENNCQVSIEKILYFLNPDNKFD